MSTMMQDFEKLIQQAELLSYQLNAQQGLRALRIVAQFQDKLATNVEQAALEQVNRLQEALNETAVTSSHINFANDFVVCRTSDLDEAAVVVKHEIDSAYCEEEGGETRGLNNAFLNNPSMSAYNAVTSEPSSSPSKRQFLCDQCGTVFSSSSCLSKHKRCVHSAARPYGCNVCKRRFIHIAALRNHQRQCSGAPSSGALATHNRHGLPRMLNSHKRRKGKIYVCRHCPAQFHFPYSVLRHERRVHHLNSADREAQIFQCVQCEARFATQVSLLKHVDLRHAPIQKSRVQQSTNDFCCSLCDVTFAHEDEFYLHWNEKHEDVAMHQNDASHALPDSTPPKVSKSCVKGARGSKYRKKCSFCNVTCMSDNTLQRHMRFHTGERPYKCSQCTMSFVRKDYLKGHLRRAHGLELSK